MFELQMNCKVLTLELDNWNVFKLMPLLGLDICSHGPQTSNTSNRDLDS